jgi:hypothetical protein
MPLYQYGGSAFLWKDVEQYIAPAFEEYPTAARSDLIRTAEEHGAPDELVDLLDSLNEARQYSGVDELRQDLVSMGHVTEG